MNCDNNEWISRFEEHGLCEKGEGRNATKLLLWRRKTSMKIQKNNTR